MSDNELLFSSFTGDLFSKMSDFTLKTNIIFLKDVLGDINSAEFFEIISMYYSAGEYDMIQLLNVIEVYLEYCTQNSVRNNSYFPVILQVVLSQINNKNLEIKLTATKCIIKLIGSDYTHVVYKSLSHQIDDGDFRIKLWVIKGIEDYSNRELIILLEKMVTDNNYLVRQASRRVLDKFVDK